MRNVIYDDRPDTLTGYACGTCGAPILPDEMGADKWHCGHDATIRLEPIPEEALKRLWED